jgi:hypothetical protein
MTSGSRIYFLGGLGRDRTVVGGERLKMSGQVKFNNNVGTHCMQVNPEGKSFMHNSLLCTITCIDEFM